jgi:hypothetical protein
MTPISLRGAAKEAIYGTAGCLLLVFLSVTALWVAGPIYRTMGLPGIIVELVFLIFAILTAGRFIHDRL